MILVILEALCRAQQSIFMARTVTNDALVQSMPSGPRARGLLSASRVVTAPVALAATTRRTHHCGWCDDADRNSVPRWIWSGYVAQDMYIYIYVFIIYNIHISTYCVYSYMCMYIYMYTYMRTCVWSTAV